jgi:hypothetical protein
MGCKKLWNREYLVDNFPMTFINNEYKKHHTNLLYEREIALLEQTQTVIEERKRREELKMYYTFISHFNRLYQREHDQILVHKKCIKELNNFPRYIDKVDLVQNTTRAEKILKEAELLSKAIEKMKEIKKKKEEYLEKIKNLGGNVEDGEVVDQAGDLESFKETHVKNIEKFYGHCPEPDCRGFINSSWKCGICEITVCKSCKEKIADPNDSNHTCNPDTIETLKKIRKESKNCPKCKVYIQKIEGCRQMWCTNCQTTFDWNTGEMVITQNIHNPHYYEWMRSNGKLNRGAEFEQLNCAEYPSAYILNDVLRHGHTSTDQIRQRCVEFLLELHRIYRHIHGIELPRYRGIIQNDVNLEYRIQYMKKEVDTDKFKRSVEMSFKKKQKANDIALVYDMFLNILKMQFYELISIERLEKPEQYYHYKKAETRDLLKYIAVTKELVEYTNNSFIKLKEIYKNKMPTVGIDLSHVVDLIEEQDQ